MCAWIKTPKDDNAGGRILAKRGTWEFVAPRYNGPISFYANGRGHKNIGSTRVDDNKWHHVAVTYLPGTMNAYVDGRFDGSASFEVCPNSDPLLLGARTKQGEDTFHR